MTLHHLTDALRFKEIARAYEILSDGRSRAMYDTQRRYGKSATSRPGTPAPRPPKAEERITPLRQKARCTSKSQTSDILSSGDTWVDRLLRFSHLRW
eukprot:750817-Hanusia_phi.AAC.2